MKICTVAENSLPGAISLNEYQNKLPFDSFFGLKLIIRPTTGFIEEQIQGRFHLIKDILVQGLAFPLLNGYGKNASLLGQCPEWGISW